jgi:hypothetical protein
LRGRSSRVHIDDLDAGADRVPVFVDMDASRCGPVASNQHDRPRRGGQLRATDVADGSSSASRVRDLPVGQLTCKLAGPIPDFQGCRLSATTCRSAVQSERRQWVR